MRDREFVHRESSRSLIAPLWFALLGGLGSVLFFYPGLMSFDSLQQFRQVVGMLPVTDSHPAAMVYLWRFFNAVAYGPGGLFLFHVVLYWLALYLFAAAVWDSALPRVLTILLIGLNPAVLVHSLHIWKDASLQVAVMLSVALLIHQQRVAATWKPVLAVVLLAYGVAVRHNAIFALLPLLAWASWATTDHWKSKLRVGLRVCISLTIVAGSLINVNVINSYNVKHVPALGTLALWDMVGVSVRAGQNLIPDNYFIEKEAQQVASDQSRDNRASFERLTRQYRSDRNYTVYDVVSPYQYSSNRQLISDWLTVVRAHPSLYIDHRLDVVKTMFGIGQGKVYYAYHPGIDQNEFGFVRNPENDRRVFAWLDAASGSFLMFGWLYVLLALLCSLAWMLRLRVVGFAAVPFAGITLCVVSWLHWIPLFIVAPASDYRYLNVGIVATVLSAALLIKDLCSHKFEVGSTNRTQGS